ncbi:MAG: hypothetical protein AAB601_00985, partial [Patescibacteria group bacterium]
LSRHSPLDVHQSFLVVGIISVLVFFSVAATLLKDIIRFPWLLVPLLFLPYLFNVLREVFEPDAFYLALSALLFLFLYRNQEGLSLLSFFLLFLTRETTIILGLLCVATGWFRSRKLLAVGMIVIIGISLFVTGVIKNVGQPNIHNLNSSVYIVLKFSYNLMTNIVGMRPWTSTSGNCSPVFQIHLPPVEALGSIRDIGLCGFDPSLPLKTLVALTTVFGVAPLVLCYLLAKRFRYVLKTLPFWALLALLYGLAFYGIGAIAGTGIERIVGYGWPAFLIITPILLRTFFVTDSAFVVKISLIHLATAWLPFLVYRVAGDGIGSVIALAIAVAAFYGYALQILKRHVIQKTGGAELPPRFPSTERT